MNKTYLLVALLFNGFIARSEIVASVNYFQYSKSEQVQAQGQTPSNQDTQLLSYDYNLQLLVGARYLIGVNYSVQSSGSTVRSKRESVFPNVGFFYGPLLLEGGPVTKSVEKLNLDTSEEWRDPSGYYGAVTIYHSWASWMLVGFQFTFLNIEFRKYFDGVGEVTTQTRKVTVLNPSLRLSFLF